MKVNMKHESGRCLKCGYSIESDNYSNMKFDGDIITKHYDCPMCNFVGVEYHHKTVGFLYHTSYRLGAVLLTNEYEIN